MILVFISLLTLITKGNRLIFIIIALEFMLLGTFFVLSFYFTEIMFYIFLVFGVFCSVLGLIMVVVSMKFYGDDYCLF